jgi:F-type H+-transporting ATPase subunit gamma
VGPVETLQALKRTISSVEDLQSIVRTMKALAAVSIRQYERALESLADYNRTVELGGHVVLRHRPAGWTPARATHRDRLGAVVFGSDQGMCGQFNEQIASWAIDEMEGLGVAKEQRRIIAVGVRALARLEEAGQPVEETFAVPGSVTGITPIVQDVLILIDRWASQRAIDQVLLFYNRSSSGSGYRSHTLRLLPVDLEQFQRLERLTWPSRVLPTFSMDWERLFSALTRQYLFVSVYRAFAESLANENASRLAAMRAAEKNIAEHLEDLTTRFHQLRQSAITGELLDIVSGFEVSVSRE